MVPPLETLDIAAPPPEVVAALGPLGQALDHELPVKLPGENLLVATWNLRALGDFTRKWVSTEGDSPKRDGGDLLAIAAVLSRFDVIAVQEVRGNIAALRHLLKALGPTWSFVLTDVCGGDEGNDERMGPTSSTRSECGCPGSPVSWWRRSGNRGSSPAPWPSSSRARPTR